MKPICAVAVNGKDITKAVETGLVSINTNDEAGFQSDTVKVVIADPRKEIALPSKGATMDVYLGFVHTGASHVGTYTVDTVGRAGKPSSLTISGKGADLTGNSKLKQQKTRSFDNITIGALVEKLAGEHGLKAAVGEDFKAMQIAHLDQVDESDMNLLTRVANDHGAIFKPADGHLVFAAKGQGKTVTGKVLPTITVTEDMCSEWNVEIAERTNYKSVVAYWQDAAAGARKEVKVGEGEPVFTIRKPYADEAAAQAAAKAKQADLDRGTGAATFTLSVGEPSAFAESPLALSKFDPELDGRWVAAKVSHSFSGSGFTTSIEAEPPTA
ncbi:MAG: hypothetical protein H7Z12_10595 [Rhodospirillaceae bacterium]|nr:hypothetical protein [Rhodospirillales bacterium]